LDPALELSAYRVVQEALTNAGKHAPGSKVTVQVVYGNDDVRVEVADDGAASTPPELPGSGKGLVGMRERVAMFGGTFEAARGDGGGFRVAASFPFAAESP
jgi:signal transduction histidine kinase